MGKRGRMERALERQVSSFFIISAPGESLTHCPFQVSRVAIHPGRGKGRAGLDLWHGRRVLDVFPGLQALLRETGNLQLESRFVDGRWFERGEEEVGDERLRGRVGSGCHRWRLSQLFGYISHSLCGSIVLSSLITEHSILDSFWHNPQYRVTLQYPDEGDENCTVIVALMQKNRRAQRSAGADCLTIGFAIYHVSNLAFQPESSILTIRHFQLDDPDRLPKPLDYKFFKYNSSVARSPSFINLREVSCRFKLPPGVYCVVPSTFDPNEEGEFLLRIFSENKSTLEYVTSVY